jgi:hypothetical protein
VRPVKEFHLLQQSSVMAKSYSDIVDRPIHFTHAIPKKVVVEAGRSLALPLRRKRRTVPQEDSPTKVARK